MANELDEPSDRELAVERSSSERRAPSARELSLRTELVHVRHELRALLDDLDRVVREPSQPVHSAVVTAVVTRTVLIQPARRSESSR
jgi:hypothetical protein